MTVLLTGATGFVGSAVLRKLLGRGDSVRVLVRPRSDRRNLGDLPVEVVEGDLTQPRTLTSVVAGCDVVYHVAADYRLWVRDPEPMFRANVDGSLAIARAAAEAGARRIVYTSSVAVLGTGTADAAADEETPVSLDDMIGPYKRSKFIAEERLGAFAAESGAPLVIVNPSTPIGPRDLKPTPTGKVIIEAASGRMPAYVNTGLNIVHVDDVADGHLLAADRGRIGERYILGGTDLSLADLLRRIAAIAGRHPPRVSLPHATVMPIAMIAECWARLSGREPFATLDGIRMARKWMYFSSAKAARELGYQFREPDEALRDAISWFRQAGYLRPS